MSSTGKAVLIVGSLVAYIVAIGLNAYFNIPAISPFNATIGDLSHKYDTGITPSDATFSIWSLIYLWLAALCIYCQTLLCRRADGEPLFVNPGFVPTVFFISFLITMIGNPLWIAVYLLEELIAAAFVLIFGVLTALVCLDSSVARLDDCGADMEKKGLKADIWCTRIIIQNGIAIYTGWVTCATLIQVVSVAVYMYSVSMDMACYAALAVLAAVILGWFIAETFLYDHKLRYVFGHYIAFLAALSGGYVKNYDPEVRYTQVSLALLVIVSIFTAIKLVVIIVKSIKDPIHYKPGSDSKYKVLH